MPSRRIVGWVAIVVAIWAEDARSPGRARKRGGLKGVALALSTNDFSPPTKVGVVSSDPINESSGLAASQRNDGVLWTHNDLSDSNRVFAIKAEGGDLLGSFVLEGAIAGNCKYVKCVRGALDFEDISVGPGPIEGASYLYVGDIGSARGSRDNNSTIEVHRVSEPVVDAKGGGNQSATLGNVDTITLKYPGQYYDAETLMVDPLSGDIYIVTKSVYNKVYLARAPHLVDGTPIVLEFMGEMRQRYATGGDVSFNGLEVIIKSASKVHIYMRDTDMELWEAIVRPAEGVPLRYIKEPKGESIAFAKDGGGYFTLSESVRAKTVPLYFYKRGGILPGLEGSQIGSLVPTPPSTPSAALCKDQTTMSDCQNMVTDRGCKWTQKFNTCVIAKRCGHLRSKQACLGSTTYNCAYSHKNTMMQVCTEFSNRCQVAKNRVVCEKNSGCQWNGVACNIK